MQNSNSEANGDMASNRIYTVLQRLLRDISEHRAVGPAYMKGGRAHT